MSWFTDKVQDLDNPAAPTTPTRAIGTAFQPSTTGYVLCMYTINLETAHGESGGVELRSDAANPPTTVRCSALAALTDDTASMVTRQQLTYVCPPGHYVKLVATGTGTFTIAHQTEDVIS